MKTTATRYPAFLRLTGSILAVAVTGSMLAGCGQDDQSPAAEMTPSPASTPSVAATPAPIPSPSARPSATKKPSAPVEGDGDGEGDGEPAAAGGGICMSLSEAEVGTVLGGAVTGSAIPGGGCSFNQRQPDPPAATFSDVAFADMDGGMAGAQENATSSVEGTPENLTGIGQAAFVVTGTSFGGTEIQGAGAVRVGDRLISVNLAQSAGLKRAQVRALVVSLLKLATSRAA